MGEDNNSSSSTSNKELNENDNTPAGAVMIETAIDLLKSNAAAAASAGGSGSFTGKKKRPREPEEEDSQDEEGDKSPPSSSSPSLPPPPAYGTKQYWEDRYKKSRPSLRLKDNKNSRSDGSRGGNVDNTNSSCDNADHNNNNNKDDRNDDGNKNTNNDDDDDDDDDIPDPFHAWYFTFEELAPLLLPLILGGNDDDDDDDGEEEDKEEEEEENQDSSNESHVKRMKRNSIDKKDPTEEEGDDENEGIHDEDEIPPNSHGDDGGLIKNGPISVLEIGCGDVPLGRDLVVAIEEMYGKGSSSSSSITNNNNDGDDVESEKSGNAKPTSIIEKVVCIDYSQNVIDAMNEDLKNFRGDNTTNDGSAESNKEEKIPLSYEVADARKMSYDDESFDMILEKGTLDAMLSGGDGGGSDNCRLIVSECARLLKKGGIIVVISHVNAHTDTGLQWLNDIIVPGLRKGAGKFPWFVEVHGNEPDSLLSDDDNSNDDDSDEESPGPCVYIIKKGTTEFHDDKFDPENPPTIPLMFFNY